MRQNYERVDPKEMRKSGRYAHAKQFKKMQKCNKKLEVYLGRVCRDLERKIKQDQGVQEVFKPTLAIGKNFLNKLKRAKTKLTAYTSQMFIAFPKENLENLMSMEVKYRLLLHKKTALF